MKIFAVYFIVKLTTKPEWFDSFRGKYDEDSDLHITLIQPRYIEEHKIDELKTKVADFLNKNKLKNEDKTVVFSDSVCEIEPDGTYTLMLPLEKPESILNFQKSLMNIVSKFNHYVNDIKRQYEKDFRPHITVGRAIQSDELETIESYFKPKPVIEGELIDLVLPIVKDTSLEERKKQDNFIIFSLV